MLKVAEEQEANGSVEGRQSSDENTNGNKDNGSGNLRRAEPLGRVHLGQPPRLISFRDLICPPN